MGLPSTRCPKGYNQSQLGFYKTDLPDELKVKRGICQLETQFKAHVELFAILRGIRFQLRVIWGSLKLPKEFLFANPDCFGPRLCFNPSKKKSLMFNKKFGLCEKYVLGKVEFEMFYLK